ncbi:MAG: hypothetical protein HY661_05555 [Betaproteobacteria bacterium]|nr:hypothetical protein [Betaproteobacteria bacterium]
MALILIEYIIAKKKKEGFTRTDGRRIWGLFWVTLFVTGLVMVLIWMTPD